jgi:predicted glutamine amidotransferase
VYSLNFVLVTESELWALRYPDDHELYLLERRAGGPTGAADLDHRGAPGTVRIRSALLASRPAVVVATERMDQDPGWRLLRGGELLHVDADLGASIATIIDTPPAIPLNLADLDPRAASSQAQR